MRRLYYVADDLPTTVEISEKIHALGITDWNFHVLAKSETGFRTHHLHSALPYHKRDFIRAEERWAILGSATGLLFAALIHQSVVHLNPVTGGLITLIGLLIGVGIGAVRGKSKENYKIARFHDDVESGRYLVMVDVTKRSKIDVIELMNLQFDRVEYRGSDSTFVNPFIRTT